MKLQATYIGRRSEPSTEPKGKPWEHFAWTVTLEHEGRVMDVPYKCGLAHVDVKPMRPWQRGDVRYNAFGPGKDGIATPKAPSLFDVLYSLLSDARGYDDARSFDGWCGDYGYSSDSIKAEGMYRACGESARDLRRVLGSALYYELIALDEDQLKARIDDQSAEVRRAPEGSV